MSPAKVAVVGGGVIGVATAYRLTLKQQPLHCDDLEVTLISREFSPYTTGDGSAGFLYPYLVGDTPKSLLYELFKETFEYYHELLRNEVDVGIGYMPLYFLHEQEDKSDEFFKDILLGYRYLEPQEIEQFNDRTYKFGHFCVSLFAECHKLLPWMMKQFVERGGKVVTKTITDIDQLQDFDCVINCLGLKATTLATDDCDLQPIRGQVHRVYAPWIKFTLFAGDAYIIPNSNYVTLGGTHQEGDWNVAVDKDDEKFILEECAKLVPALRNAERVCDWVGLRPGRSSIRLDVEYRKLKNGKLLLIVHNYGHGGSGVSLAWGSARKAIELMNQAFSAAKSKL